MNEEKITLLEAMEISPAVSAFCEKQEASVRAKFAEIDEICEYNQWKVLDAFQKERVSDQHFETTSGYGYTDIGRDTLERVFARVFHTEDALVRPQIISGTHALAVTVFGLVPSLTNMLAKGVLPCTAQAWARGDRPAAAVYARQVLSLTGLLCIPAGCGLFALSRESLTFLFAGRSAEIGAAWQSLRALSPAVICLCLTYPLFSLLQAIGQERLPVLLMLPGLLVKCAGNLLLVPRLGITGAALSTSLCYAVILVPALIVLRRTLGAPLHLAGVLLPQGFAGVLCGAAAYVCFGMMQGFPQRIAFFLAVLAGGAVYALALWLLTGHSVPAMLRPDGDL